jgi:hypothetical protein
MKLMSCSCTHAIPSNILPLSCFLLPLLPQQQILVPYHAHFSKLSGPNILKMDLHASTGTDANVAGHGGKIAYKTIQW